jgi:nitrogenase molybdenum-iron protein alpha chain
VIKSKFGEEVAIREQRLGSITGFKGSVKDLISKESACPLKNSGRCFSQASSCMAGSVQGYLAEIADAVIVNHAPVGCATDQIGGNTLNKWSEKARGWKNWQPRNIGFFSTNMTKEDTVFGATEKLKDTIREAYRRYKPAAIFITTSCVTGIIGEDIQSALDDLKDEIPIPLAPVYCEGFKTKVWATGRDMGFHAILTTIVKPPRQKTNKVNMFNFHASARKEITEMFARLGLEPVFLVAQTTVEELSRISEAAASVSVCGTLSTPRKRSG